MSSAFLQRIPVVFLSVGTLQKQSKQKTQKHIMIEDTPLRMHLRFLGVHLDAHSTRRVLGLHYMPIRYCEHMYYMVLGNIDLIYFVNN